MSKRKRRRYAAEFKREAVNLATGKACLVGGVAGPNQV